MWALILLPIFVTADIYSCGGFLKSESQLDYSKIKVRLLSSEGHLKHEEDCNPQNGYYMIPVYKKGSYSLKVQAADGFYFEPSQIDIVIDGVNDPCSKNEDINFKLTALSVNGIIGTKLGAGPSGLPLTLQKNGKIMDKTITGDGGVYSFKALPGTYEVVADTETTACISKGSASVEVISSPVVVSPALQISGYKVSVDVRHDKVALKDVSLTLYSDVILDNLTCQKNTNGNISKKFSCSYGRTNTNGRIEFGCIPLASFIVEPSYETESMVLNFRPALKEFEVKADQIQISFDVSGFSLRGRVIRDQEGVAGASITVGGVVSGKTDDNGYYTLSGLSEGPIVLSAEKPQTRFSVVKATVKLPNIVVPDIVVEGFEICGSVEKSAFSENAEQLIATSKDKSTSFTIQPNTDGRFCEMALLSTYTLSPKKTSSTLTPRSVKIDNLQGPVDNLRFSHFKTDVDVSVTCIGTCGKITVDLLSGTTVVQSLNGADVIFRDVAPGTYIVRVTDDEGRCWEKSELQLTVDRNRPVPVHFVQSGFQAKFFISHSAKLFWNHAEKKQLKGELEANPGEVFICVPVQGKYNARVESCRNFSPNAVEFIVPASTLIKFSALDAGIKGYVNSKEKGSFSVNVRSASGNRDVSVTNGEFLFYEPLSTAGKIVIVPQSDIYLFDPKSITFDFGGECIDGVGKFTADKGIFVDGAIRPPVSGVQIMAMHSDDSNVKFEVLSDSHGKYRVGPVRKVTDLSFSASLEGFEFKQVPESPSDFFSVKLSKLSVTLVDVDSENRLAGVLLSLTGGKEFRSNPIVGEDGETNFVGLAPGDYFLRPILQEFKFTPPMTEIKVKEGEHEHVTLKGKRYLFSAHGKVREMSKKPVSGVVIEAISEQCDRLQSDATTAADGTFTIKELKPKCLYRISPKSGPDNLSAPHCFPSFFDVNMTAEDVNDLEMIATIQKQQTELIVEMDFASMEVPQNYRVSVVRRTGESISTSVIHGPVTSFYMKGLERDGCEYSVRVEPDKHSLSFNAKTVFFTADAPVRVVRVPMTSSKKSSDVEIGLGSLLVLPLFSLIILAFLNQEKANELWESLISYVRSSSNDRNKRKQR